MNNKTSQFSFRMLSIDFILLTVSFFALNYYKRGTLVLDPPYYVKLLFAFYIIWLLVSLSIKKFHPDSYQNYWDLIRLSTKSTVFIGYLVSFMVVLMGLPGFSRLHIFGTCLLLFLFNTVLLSTFLVRNGKDRTVYAKSDAVTPKTKQDTSILLILTDFIVITVLFFTVNYLKRGTFNLLPIYETLLLIVYGLWFVTGIITRKFDKRNFQNYYFAIAPCIKSAVLMALSMSLIIFAFRLFFFSRGQVFGSFLLLVLIEAALYFFYFIYIQNGKPGTDIESIDEVRSLLEQHALCPAKEEDGSGHPSVNPVKGRLRRRDLRSNPWLFDFINSSINLSEIDREESACLSTRDVYNIQTMDDSGLRLFINLHKVNNIRSLNRYFLEIHKKLKVGGYFIGRANTIFTHKRWFFDNYPKYFAEFFLALHFFLFRTLPTLPGIKRIYFAVTDGTNRTISGAEVLGRLCFCGFEIIAEKEIDYNSYFIARKVKMPSVDTSPSYGPLIKMKRTGLNGHMITVFKFRTMYPYAEFLQDHVFKKNNLVEGGKIADDFRLTELGKFMRKIWLDELPMVYNWLRGEVKLFGVRPLSMQYLSLYTDELKEMRKKIKPGLIPPFYADMPKTLAEICNSEKRYIEAYLERPIRTQWVYFWKALNNIVIKGARSH